MSKATDTTHLKQLLWTRLSAHPDTLDLDDRINEQPEDLFVRMATAGERDAVVAALRSHLVRCAGGTVAPTHLPRALRFLSRAIRLCDSLGGVECKDALKLLLLQEEPGPWGEYLAEVQELAARVLSGLPKKPTDLELWCHVARACSPALPYALNAAIEIDVERGVELLARTYDRLAPRRRNAVNWRAILQIAATMHGVEALGDALGRALADKSVLEYERFVRLAGLPELRKQMTVALSDLVGYSQGRGGDQTSYTLGKSAGGEYRLTGTSAQEVRPRTAFEDVTGPGYGLALPLQAIVEQGAPRWLNYYPPNAGEAKGLAHEQER